MRRHGMQLIGWFLKWALFAALLLPSRLTVTARGRTQDQSSPRANTLYDDADDTQRQLDNEAKERLKQLIRPKIIWNFHFPSNWGPQSPTAPLLRPDRIAPTRAPPRALGKQRTRPIL